MVQCITMMCNICNSDVPKYKCPTCKIPYCSLGCWKTHKSSPTNCESIILENNSTSEIAPANLDGAVAASPYNYPTDDTVPLEKLKLLETNKSLHHVLDNPHVRDILLAIDSSPNPRDAIHAAMLEPIFVEFADACFKIVEPQALNFNRS